MKIQILGSGCPKCKRLEENTRKAIAELDGDYEIQKVTDLDEIMEYGIMMTPGFAINKNVKSVGKVLTSDQIKDFIQKQGK